MDWSPDGRYLLYDILDSKRGFDMWALPLGEGSRAKALRGGPDGVQRRSRAVFSRRTWIAYQSDKTGRFEIYLRPFPGPGGDSRVHSDGGEVRWNPNGKELFYIAADDRLMAVPIGSLQTVSRRPGTPLALFTTNVGSAAFNADQATIHGCPGRSVVRDELHLGGGARRPSPSS